MRSSGHESFVCRYPWLPKAYAHLSENPRFFSDEADAMVILGLGKNMVRALRFWVQAFGVATPTDRSGRELVPTEFAERIFDVEDGWDPYLEDTRTLWLLHWNLTTQQNSLLAWEELFFRWSGRDILRSSAVAQFKERAEAEKMRATQRTLTQHFDIFVNTYFSAKIDDSSKVLEDSLDCPLVELRLLVAAGKKPRERGAPERIYQLRQEPKSDVRPAIFLHCLTEYWSAKHPQEQTLNLQQISTEPHSPGAVFCLPEADIRRRLELIERTSLGHYSYVESVNLQQVRRSESEPPDFIDSIYEEGVYG